MSTRQTHYYSDLNAEGPHIHIYRELSDPPPNDMRMEIELPGVLVDIPLPIDLQKMLGIEVEAGE